MKNNLFKSVDKFIQRNFKIFLIEKFSIIQAGQKYPLVALDHNFRISGNRIVDGNEICHQGACVISQAEVFLMVPHNCDQNLFREIEKALVE